MANLPNLTHLNLESNNIKDIKPLANEEGFRNLLVKINLIFLKKILEFKFK